MPPNRRRPKPKARRTPVRRTNTPWSQIGTPYIASATIPTGTGVISAPSANTPSETGGIPIGPGSAIEGAGGTATTGAFSTNPVVRFVELVPAYLKIAGGGLIVIISGLALVYVAGRNTAPVAATKEAIKVATPAGRAASIVGGATKKRVSPKGREERRDAKFYKQAYDNTAEAKEGRAAARSTKVLPRVPGSRGGSGKAYRKGASV